MAKKDEDNLPQQITEDQIAEIAEKVIDKVLEPRTLQKVDDAIREEIKVLDIEAVAKIAGEVLGSDYWEVIQIANHMKDRKVEMHYKDIDNILMALGGYYMPVKQSAGILWSQIRTAQAEIIVERKKKGDTDKTAQARADISCQKLWRQFEVFNNLAEGMVELINILKKVREDLAYEYYQASSTQPGSSHGVAVLSPHKPWVTSKSDDN